MPDLFFVGPERTGTTWLHQYLLMREDIRLPVKTKETFFFDRHFERGVDWYLSHFAADTGLPFMAEVAPTYFHNPEAAARIRQLCPDARIVCTLRDPVKRSFSHFLHMRAYGTTAHSLPKAAREHPQIIEASRYARHIQRLQTQFGPGQVHLAVLDDLSTDSEKFARDLCDALGLPYIAPRPELAQSRVNTTGTPRNPKLARLGYLLRTPLRKARMYKLIELAKRMGVRKLIFGVKTGEPAKPSVEELAFLRTELQGEVEAVEKLLQREMPKWHFTQ